MRYRLPVQSKEDQIYDYLVSFWKEHQYPPTLRELSGGTGICMTTLYYHLQQMEIDIRIKRTPFVARSIVPVGLTITFS